MGGRLYQPAGATFAVDGTVYPGAPFPPQPILNDGTGYWCGFASGMVGGLINTQDGLWGPSPDVANSCVGYPATTFPMGASVQIGRANLNFELATYAEWYYRTHNSSFQGMVITIEGYSQGAMVVTATVLSDILTKGAALAYLAPYLYRVYLYGDPLRCPGIAYGTTEIAGLPLPPNVDSQITGGIGGPLDYTLVQANTLAPDGRHLINSFVNAGDLYADCPVGLMGPAWGGASSTTLSKVGKVEVGIFNIVQKATFIDVVSLAKDLFTPVATVEGIINAGSFFAQAGNAPHYQYFAQMDAAINDAMQLGLAQPYLPGS